MTDFIPTRSSRKKENAEINLDVVVHKAYKPKKRHTPAAEMVMSEEKGTETATNEINMKRARFEIIKFGMSGFNNRKKEEAKVQLAIKLGAKPPKNKYKNYKEVLKERKKQKIREEKQILKQQQGKTRITGMISQKKGYDKKRRKNKGLLEVYGTVKAKNNK